MTKVLLEKIIPTWGNPLEHHRDQRTILLIRYFDKYVLFGQFYNTFPVLTTLNPRLVEYTNNITRTQLATFVEAFQMPQLKELSFVFISLGSTPFGVCKFLNFEIVTECAVHFSPAFFDSQPIKREPFQ